MTEILSVIHIILYLLIGGGFIYYIKLLKQQVDALDGIVPPENRKDYVNSIYIPSPLNRVRETLHQIAEAAPYLPSTRKFDAAIEALVQFAQMKRPPDVKMQDQHQPELARTSILPSLPTVPRHYLNHPTQPQIRHYSKK